METAKAQLAACALPESFHEIQIRQRDRVARDVPLSVGCEQDEPNTTRIPGGNELRDLAHEGPRARRQLDADDPDRRVRRALLPHEHSLAVRCEAKDVVVGIDPVNWPGRSPVD